MGFIFKTGFGFLSVARFGSTLFHVSILKNDGEKSGTPYGKISLHGPYEISGIWQHLQPNFSEIHPVGRSLPKCWEPFAYIEEFGIFRLNFVKYGRFHQVSHQPYSSISEKNRHRSRTLGWIQAILPHSIFDQRIYII